MRQADRNDYPMKGGGNAGTGKRENRSPLSIPPSFRRGLPLKIFIPGSISTTRKILEDTIEQNDNNFDGIINNTPSVDELEKKAKSGEQISLTDLADAIEAEKTRGKGKEEKHSIRAQLKADKKKAQKKTARQKSQDLKRS
mgnify:CR=1 FL=1